MKSIKDIKNIQEQVENTATICEREFSEDDFELASAALEILTMPKFKSIFEFCKNNFTTNAMTLLSNKLKQIKSRKFVSKEEFYSLRQDIERDYRNNKKETVKIININQQAINIINKLKLNKPQILKDINLYNEFIQNYKNGFGFDVDNFNQNLSKFNLQPNIDSIHKKLLELTNKCEKHHSVLLNTYQHQYNDAVKIEKQVQETIRQQLFIFYNKDWFDWYIKKLTDTSVPGKQGAKNASRVQLYHLKEYFKNGDLNEFNKAMETNFNLKTSIENFKKQLETFMIKFEREMLELFDLRNPYSIIEIKNHQYAKQQNIKIGNFFNKSKKEYKNNSHWNLPKISNINTRSIKNS